MLKLDGLWDCPLCWDHIAEVGGRYLGKGQRVAVEGRIQTRTWDDEKGLRHWKIELVATNVEMLSVARSRTT